MKNKILVTALAVVGVVIASVGAPMTTFATPDTTPPPTPGGFAMIQRTPTTLGLTWQWTMDNTGYVPQYELYYNGNTVLVNHYYPGHTISTAGLNLQTGNAYTIELKAVDAAGNRSVVPAQLVFETTPPHQAASNLQLLTTHVGYPDMIGFTAAADNAGIMRYEVLVNGESLGNTYNASTQFSLQEQYLVAGVDQPSGQATVQLRAIDTSFNPSSQLSDPLTVTFP